MTLDQLKLVMPRCPDDWAQALLSAMPHWDITTPIREAAFLAQFAVETNEFRAVVENLKYSPEGLAHTWKRFAENPDDPPSARRPNALALEYAHQDEKLANYIYADANRDPAHALGNVNPGDGWMYRGRPAITGRDMYKAAGLALNLPLEDQPELAERPSVSIEIDCWIWYSKGCNDFADKTLAEDNAFTQITRRITGGMSGHDKRIAYFVKFKEVLGL